MNNEVLKARDELTAGGFTCVVHHGGEVFTSHERGVKPLIELLNSGRTFTGAVAADKTVGAGAAHLYVLLGVSALWANVVSESAKAILDANGIDLAFGECVPHIINRRGDGLCPIETAVKAATTSTEAYALILAALARLSAK